MIEQGRKLGRGQPHDTLAHRRPLERMPPVNSAALLADADEPV